ncbi:MAG: hypothetical protein PHI53_03655 [Candidatus Pacebacteria bacterium]|nr:hypothetical protein [Candidatus Paceibacterota bacterium]
MARITRKKKIDNVAPIITGLTFGLPLLAFGPLGLLGFFIGFKVAKQGIADDMRKEGADDVADKITNDWLNNRFVGERKISVTREKPMGGLLPISMSVTHTTEIHDFEENDAHHTYDLTELDDLRRHARQSAKGQIERRMYDLISSSNNLIVLAEMRNRMAVSSHMRNRVDERLRTLIKEERNRIVLLRAESVLDRSPSLLSQIKLRIRSLE